MSPTLFKFIVHTRDSEIECLVHEEQVENILSQVDDRGLRFLSFTDAEDVDVGLALDQIVFFSIRGVGRFLG